MQPVIQVNQEGAALINTLLDYAMKGGGLASLNTVNSVIRIINTPPPQATLVAKDAPNPIPKSESGKVVEKKDGLSLDNPGNKDTRAK